MICLYSTQGVELTSRETHSYIEKILYLHKSLILYHSISATVDATFTTSCRVKADDWGVNWSCKSAMHRKGRIN